MSNSDFLIVAHSVSLLFESTLENCPKKVFFLREDIENLFCKGEKNKSLVKFL